MRWQGWHISWRGVGLRDVVRQEVNLSAKLWREKDRQGLEKVGEVNAAFVNESQRSRNCCFEVLWK